MKSKILKIFLMNLTFYAAGICCYLIGSGGQFSTRDFAFLGLTLIYGGLTLSYGFSSKLMVLNAVEQTEAAEEAEFEKKRKKYPGAVRQSTTELGGVPSWDKPLRYAYIVLMYGVFYFVAGLNCDVTQTMDKMFFLGMIIMFISLMIRSKALRTQPYLDPLVALDAKYIVSFRNADVYQKMRHPAQGAAVLFTLGAMCTAYSEPVVIVGAFIIALIFIRTVKEDQYLHDNVASFQAYEKEVKYKILPHLF